MRRLSNIFITFRPLRNDPPKSFLVTPKKHVSAQRAPARSPHHQFIDPAPAGPLSRSQGGQLSFLDLPAGDMHLIARRNFKIH